MKFGLRKPSLKKRIAARTSPKRLIRHSLGLKAPKGMGWLTNPKKAAYNRAYSRTTFSIDDLFKGGKKGDAAIIMLIIMVIVGTAYLLWAIVKGICKFVLYLTQTNTVSKAQDVTPARSFRDIARIPNEISCPRCHGFMVKRLAKKGPYRGQEFYGCTRFPICKGTRSA